MALEKVVRPYQSFDVTPPRRVISGTGNSVAGVALQIGRTGSGRTMNGSITEKTTFYVDSHDNEMVVLFIHGEDGGDAFYTGMGAIVPGKG